MCDTIIELWAAPERHRSARLAPVTGTPLLRRARPARGAERTIDPSGGHSPAVQRAHLMRLCLPQDLRHTSTAHLARPPCVAEPGYLIELCSQRSRTYPHTGHPHDHPQTGSDNRVSESWKVERVKAPSDSRMENRTPNTSKELCQKPFHPFFWPPQTCVSSPCSCERIRARARVNRQAQGRFIGRVGAGQLRRVV